MMATFDLSVVLKKYIFKKRQTFLRSVSLC